MKTVFIINPMAGKKRNIEALKDSILAAKEKLSADVQIYVTRAVGDATDFVRSLCTDERVRFIACGGDGTLSEVLNGAKDRAEAEIGVIPIGTGNDFSRNFGDGYDFLDPSLQITGRTTLCDAIKYTTTTDGKTFEGYCANMFNIGFDCNVADLMTSIKEKTVLSGSLAYFASILVNLIKKKGAELEIRLDGKTVHDGKLLLTSVANGRFCGGGVMSNPGASVNDGLININIVNNVSRLKFISLLPHYMKGTFSNLAGVEKVIRSLGCKRVTVIPKNGTVRLCVDGEIVNAGNTEFEIVHNAFCFVLPCETVAQEAASEMAMT